MSLSYGLRKGEGNIGVVAGAVIAGINNRGGRFIPGFTKPGGEVVPPRWESFVFINTYGDDKSELIKIVAWASRNPKADLNMAETFALYGSRGRNVNLTLQETRYQVPLLDRVHKTPIVHSDGTPVLDLRMSYNILGFEFRSESSQLIITELEAYKAAMANTAIQVNPFSLRSPDWNAPRVQGGPATVWDQIMAIRKSLCKYKAGMTQIGHADVVITTNRNAYGGYTAPNMAPAAGMPNMGGVPNMGQPAAGMPALPNMGNGGFIPNQGVPPYIPNGAQAMHF